jgi:hypothetical protein
MVTRSVFSSNCSNAAASAAVFIFGDRWEIVIAGKSRPGHLCCATCAEMVTTEMVTRSVFSSGDRGRASGNRDLVTFVAQFAQKW